MNALDETSHHEHDDIFDDQEVPYRMQLAAPLLRVYSVVIIVSLISVGASYSPFLTSTEWLYRFSNKSLSSGLRGFAIEAARSLLFLSLIAILLYYRFNTVTRRFIGLAKSTNSTWIFRLFYVALAIALCGIDVARQIDSSRAATKLVKTVHKEWKAMLTHDPLTLEPEDVVIVKERIENTNKCIADSARAYRVYLTYSLCNYLFAAIPIIVIWVFAIFLDLPNIHRRYNYEMAAIRAVGRSSADDAKAQWSRISASLLKFREYCTLKSAHYIDVFAVFVLSYTFEHAIGSSTLTTEANELQLVSWIPLASVAIVPVTCAVFIGGMIERCRWFAISNGIEPESDFDAKFGVATFWKTCLSVSMGGYIVILCGIPFLKAFLVVS